MECKKAYDLDGVLAKKPPAPPKKWGLMKGSERRAWKNQLELYYLRAEKLLEWDGTSIVITARKNEVGTTSATVEWFLDNYGKIPQLFFLEKSRSVENVVAFKAQVLRLHKIEEYYEDNKKVLKGLIGLYPDCKYFFVSKTLEIEPFSG